MLPIEVELASKSKARLRSVLALHAAWIAAGKTGAVVYVCGSSRGWLSACEPRPTSLA